MSTIEQAKTGLFSKGFLEVNTPEKMDYVAEINKLKKAAALYLQNEKMWQHYPCRFDVIAMVASGSGELLHFEDAWQLRTQRKHQYLERLP